MNDRRIARLQEQIKESLALVILRDLGDPKLGLVTITRVEVDSEFTQCKAYWSVLGDDKARRENEGVLRRARGLCQRAIAKSIHTRSVPHLEFVYDEGITTGIRVNKLLEDLRLERELREQNNPTGNPEPPQQGSPDAGPADAGPADAGPSDAGPSDRAPRAE
jgi:ribosome-binding factor A